MLDLLSRFAAFGETVGENHRGRDAFSADILDDGEHVLGIDGNHRERQLARNVEYARISLQPEDFGTAWIDRHDFRCVETEVLEILKNIDGVVIAVAGADDGETIGFEERRQRLIAGHESLLDETDCWCDFALSQLEIVVYGRIGSSSDGVMEWWSDGYLGECSDTFTFFRR